MDAFKELCERLKKVSDDDWERLRSSRDELVECKRGKPCAVGFVGRISVEDVDVAVMAVEEGFET